MKKLLAFLLVAVMSFAMLVSCGGNGDGDGDDNGEGGGQSTPPTAESVLAAAQAALENSAYKTSVSLGLESNNAEMNEQFQEYTAMDITLTVKGDDFSMETKIESEGVSASRSVSLINKTIYVVQSYGDQVSGRKCVLNDAQLVAANDKLKKDFAGDFALADFNSVVLSDVDGKQVITCTGIKDEAIDKINDLIDSIVGGAPVGASFNDVSIIYTVANGKFEKTAVSFGFTFEVEGESIDVDMSVDSAYDYSATELNAPANADTFEDIDYEDVVGRTSYNEYAEAPNGTYVVVETFVQGKQAWWFDSEDNTGKGTIYTQSYDGGYFLYEVPLTEEEYNALEVGTHIMVYGFKAEWDGEIEIIDAEIKILDNYTWVAFPQDATALLGTAEIEDLRDSKVYFGNMTVVASNDAGDAFLYKWNGSGNVGDDIYFKASVNGKTYTFVIESYLTPDGSEAYEAAQALKVGDVINMEAFLYWYGTSAQPHVYSITVVEAE